MYTQEYIDQLIYLIGLKEINLQMKIVDVNKLQPLAQQFLNEQHQKKVIEDMERMKRFFTIEKVESEDGSQNS